MFTEGLKGCGTVPQQSPSTWPVTLRLHRPLWSVSEEVPEPLPSCCCTTMKLLLVFKAPNIPAEVCWLSQAQPTVGGDVHGRFPLVPVMKQGKYSRNQSSEQEEGLLIRKANGPSALVNTLKERRAAPRVERTVWMFCDVLFWGFFVRTCLTCHVPHLLLFSRFRKLD